MDIQTIAENIQPLQILGMILVVIIFVWFVYSYVSDLKKREAAEKKLGSAKAELNALNKEYAVKVKELEGQFAKKPILTKRGK